MTDSEKNTQSQRVSKAPLAEPERSDAAEEKRRAARRRFLLGGAAALPVVLNVTAVKGQAVKVIAGFSVCLSIATEPGATPLPVKGQDPLTATAFVCP